MSQARKIRRRQQEQSKRGAGPLAPQRQAWEGAAERYPAELARTLQLQEAYQVLERTAAQVLGPEVFQQWEAEGGSGVREQELEATPLRAVAELERLVARARAVLARLANLTPT